MTIKILAVYLITINIITFLAFGIDKLKAKRHAWRIPEKTLLGLSFIGGSAGALAGMKLFHHKVNASRKPAFVIGVPIMLVLHIALIWYLFLRNG